MGFLALHEHLSSKRAAISFAPRTVRSAIPLRRIILTSTAPTGLAGQSALHVLHARHQDGDRPGAAAQGGDGRGGVLNRNAASVKNRKGRCRHR